MAGVYSKSDDKKVQNHMTCCLGDHPLQNPKLLPCQHSFCEGCIKDKVGQDKNEFTCPKCQLSIPLTEKEVDKLQNDVLYYTLNERAGYNAYCDMCKFEDKNIHGTFQCLDCGEVTCDQCKIIHTKTLMTRSHKLVSVKDIQGGRYKGELETARRPLCSTHSKPKSSLFLEYCCVECNCLACQICVYEEHRPNGHTCKTIDEIHDEMVTAMSDHVTKLLDLKLLDEEFAAILEEGQGHNKDLQEKLENEVHQRAALFIEIIEKVKEDKLTEIKGHFQTENTSIQETLKETKNRIIRTDSIMSYTQAFLGHSDKAEFIKHENEMMMKMKCQLQEDKNKTLKINLLEIGELQIEQTEAFIAKAFGEVKVITKMLGNNVAVKNVPRKLMKEPKMLFSVNSGIRGTCHLTISENGDIVAVEESTIQIYSSDVKPKQKFTCSKLKYVWNVVAKGYTLFVSNYSTDVNVLVMDFKGNVKKTITLPHTDQQYSYKGLAVDDKGTVYISSRVANTVYKCEHNETNAKVFIQPGTHPDLIGPWYLCVTPEGEIVVSNMGTNTIQVYGRSGNFLWQYKGHDEMKLGLPNGVCCDKRGYIYISDSSKSQVQVIKEGKYVGCVKSRNFTKPQGIDLYNEGHIVCICNNGSKITKIKAWE